MRWRSQNHVKQERAIFFQISKLNNNNNETCSQKALNIRKINCAFYHLVQGINELHCMYLRPDTSFPEPSCPESQLDTANLATFSEIYFAFIEKLKILI